MCFLSSPATSTSSKEKYNKVIQEEFKSTEDEFVVNQASPIFVVIRPIA